MSSPARSLLPRQIIRRRALITRDADRRYARRDEEVRLDWKTVAITAITSPLHYIETIGSVIVFGAAYNIYMRIYMIHRIYISATCTKPKRALTIALRKEFSVLLLYFFFSFLETFRRRPHVSAASVRLSFLSPFAPLISHSNSSAAHDQIKPDKTNRMERL